ncbi:hypothetical protein C6P40_004921 [Pichia californica]|uniref:Uncharacterized protein n=1 Tax=Pichia californica TaxID=460514 RepID=A0A9P6WLT8_9ASCO|nr:hypothetical protein C6P42_004333 [[Candida] californica]KAG0689505.1 hypothetical protein C6P40_004921 [[Candida] californica]
MQTLLNYHKTFPKVYYPTETHYETYPGRQYSLSKASSNSTFNLAVYSLSPLLTDDSTLAPVDPLCLATLISILAKEQLTLPKLDSEITDSSSSSSSSSSSNINTISILSYHASIDNQLPILIEDSKDKINHKILRKIHTSNVINAINSSNLNLKDSLIFDLINTQLLDFYILSILKLSNNDLLNYYSIYNYNFGNSTTSASHILPLDKFFISNLKFNLLKRNDFHVRNPNTFNYFTSYLLPKSSNLAYISESDSIIENATKLLKLFNDSLKSSKYWSSNDNPSIIDFQIASFIYSIQYFSPLLPNFHSIISENDILLSHSQSIISSFV